VVVIWPSLFSFFADVPDTSSRGMISSTILASRRFPLESGRTPQLRAGSGPSFFYVASGKRAFSASLLLHDL